MNAPTIGHASLAGAIVLGALSFVAAFVAARQPATGAARWTANAYRLLAAGAVAIVIAVMTLARAIVTLDYRLAYVADVANRSASRPYRLAGLWAQMAGSLLLFAAMAMVAALWGARVARRRVPTMAPVAIAFSALVAVGLAVVSRVTADPFVTLAQPAIDGAGLTPILEHWAMLVHPPLLYAALVLTLPLAALAVARWWSGDRDIDGGWVDAVRAVAALAWTMLTIALALGGRWAYAEVGWGGFWAWDPVENGGLLVWLALLVVLHGARRRDERRDAGLAVTAWSAFALAVVGSLVTRSGAAASVHAFGEATRVGHALLVLSFVVVAVSAAAWLPNVSRERRVRHRAAVADASADVGRRADPLLIVQRLVTTVALVAVLLGTLYPVVAHWFDGRRRVVDARFYTAAVTPLAAAGAVSMVAALARAPRWWRRPAMALSHVGMLVVIAGSIATSLGSDRSALLAPGSVVSVAGHELRVDRPIVVEHAHYQRIVVPVAVRDSGHDVARLTPALRVYETAGITLPETALRSTLAGDVQLAVRKVDQRGDVTIDVHVRPLAWMVWLGALMIVAGGLAATFSSRRRRRRSSSASADANEMAGAPVGV